MVNEIALAIATWLLTWKGYCEKNNDSNLSSMETKGGTGNHTIFAQMMIAAGLMGCCGQPWCITFCMAGILKICGKDKMLAVTHMRPEDGGYVGYNCFQTRDRFKKYGKYDKKNPKVGDIVIYGISHAGFITGVVGSKITVVEGNTTDQHTREGNVVAVKEYDYTDPKIDGFCHIDYTSVSAKEVTEQEVAQIKKEVYDNMPVLKKGSSGRAVKVLKSILKGLNWGPNLVINYDFDAATENVVKEFQRQKGLEPDGIVGIKTWPKLLLG